mmetsp:Transcript_2306/g.4967  ORF Transcript_2306/g.4967 Transcript_2306/m.4967 type:complete len:1771 (+) Transcript_2306:192-5504(+)
MGSSSWEPSWPRQFLVLLTKNRRLLLRRPFHLLVQLTSSAIFTILAWTAGRNGARGTAFNASFPPLDDCGVVHADYVIEKQYSNVDEWGYPSYNYDSIPNSMNEAWRDSLPSWLLSLGPTLAGVSVFLILREELQSKRWGTLKAASASAHWLSWLLAFALLGVVNSLGGAVVAAVVPDVHVFQSTDFGAVFGTLFFLTVALTAASFFLAAICGTCSSTALTVFFVMGMIVASSVPSIVNSASMAYSYEGFSIDTYSHLYGRSGGAFWLYASTGRKAVEQKDNYDDNYNYINSTMTTRECEVPIVSYEQGRYFKTPSEQDNVPKEDIFQGCYTIPAASITPSAASSFFWFWLPQYHFMAAWSNILGYTSLPKNKFSMADASKSPEELAPKALANYRGVSKTNLYDPDMTNGTSLFPQGSTVLTEQYYDPNRYSNNYYGSYDDYYAEPTGSCPSGEVSNLCNDYDGQDCYSPKRGYPSSGSPSVNDNIGYLVALVVIYSILAAYVVAVFPMDNGAAMKFYFPFQRRYWCGNRKRNDGEEDGVHAVDVSKSYGSVAALKPFSLTMKKGEVTALLGHNGAGKSTFVNVLCGEQNPTSGDIVVGGRSIKSDWNAIVKTIGQCKQEDFLWPNLTAREHLELFGGIRGVSKDDMAETVQKWLESVDLENVQHVRVGTYSGGMKRRLSVALSTIGNSSVIVLDEPTTGMDPVSRRFVWKHISAVKEGRVILLTTHAMEEADLLSDHVAIMSHGKLAAFGSPLELKTKHGSALQFSLISDKGNVGAVEEAVKSVFANSLAHVEFDASTSGYSTLTIKRVVKDQGMSQGVVQESDDTEDDIVVMATHPPNPEIFTTTPVAPAVAVPLHIGDKSSSTPKVSASLVDSMDGPSPEGVPVSSLSEFIGWLESESSPVNEFGISNSSLEEVFLAVTRHAGQPAAIQSARENRGCCSCCCFKKETRTSSEVGDIESMTSRPTQSQSTVNQLPKVNISNYERKLSAKTQIKAIVRFFLARSWTGRPSIVNWTIFGIFCIGNMMNGFGMATIWPDYTYLYFLLVTVVILSFMLISIISPLYSDRANGLFKMMLTQGMLERSFLLGTSIYSLIVQFGYSFVLLTLFYASHIFRTASVLDCSSSTVYYDGYPSYSGCSYYTKFGDKPTVRPGYSEPVLSVFSEEESVSVYAYMAPGGYGMIFAIIVVFSLTVPGAVLSSAFLPGFKLTLVGVSLVVLAASVSPGIMDIANSQDPYFFGNCTEQIEIYDDCSNSDYSLDNVDSNFVECTGLRLAYPLTYCTPAHVSILPQMGLFQSLALTFQSDIIFHSEPKEYAEQFVNKLAEEGAACSGNRCKFEYARQLFGKHIGFMLLGAVLLVILGVIVAKMTIFPSTWMVRVRHAIATTFNCRGGRKRDSSKSEEIEEMKEVDVERQHVQSLMQPVLAGPVGVEANESMPPILSYESRNAHQDQLPPVIMHKLRKVFPSLGGAPPKVALKSLDLHVPNGQVLGLLGKNGAGKTTALKILAGIHEASSGIGLISGYDVETERNRTYERLGNCPQFDCVWRNQSVQRHLEFYARLKGIENPTKAASDIATAVGLGAPEVYHRPSGNLSGGMRRRLSIGVSLIGSPSTLLLDEPTTGLDPSTRNEIWSLVSSFATPDRAIIITTHMMLEADALCSRIAIVAKGSLKVVGTQQHLKDNYGSGYLLQLNLAQDNEQTIDSLLQFIKANIHPDAKIVTKQAKTVHINLPRDVNIQKIFTTLYSDGASKAMINQFLVSQSSLEDVFLALGE